MKQTGLLLVVTGLILLQLSIQLPQQNAAWGMTLGASILLKFFVNRTDHALSAHPDRPQMNKKAAGHSVIPRLLFYIKAPCPLAGQGVC
ncbi:hypothetical protein I5R48_17690 [Bacillus velezensis]|nr:hypothetical protein I5R48_17690 [Bacillus velezensis]